MDDRASLGELEQLVLLACMRLGPEAYTVSVAAELERRADREVSHATVYVALRRLEAKGMVTSHLGDSTPERGGRPKRLFRVAPEALPLLRQSRDALMRMWDGLEPTPQ